MTDIDGLNEKYDALKACFAGLGSAAVAFSGGVDSTLLLKAAADALGDRAAAVTAHSAVFPQRELDEAADFCERRRIRQFIFRYDIKNVPHFEENGNRRCYFCKKYILEQVFRMARENGLRYVAEGSHADDEGVYRPGAEAVAELGAVSPLKLAGFTKNDIRALSKALGLPTYDKQSFACLATRVPYGDRITDEKLERIGFAEQYLLGLGLRRLRVRCHGNLARIETDEEGYALLADRGRREGAYAALREAGFTYTAVDLLGYRTGSMDE